MLFSYKEYDEDTVVNGKVNPQTYKTPKQLFNINKFFESKKESKDAVTKKSVIIGVISFCIFCIAVFMFLQLLISTINIYFFLNEDIIGRIFSLIFGVVFFIIFVAYLRFVLLYFLGKR